MILQLAYLGLSAIGMVLLWREGRTARLWVATVAAHRLLFLGDDDHHAVYSSLHGTGHGAAVHWRGRPVVRGATANR